MRSVARGLGTAFILVCLTAPATAGAGSGPDPYPRGAVLPDQDDVPGKLDLRELRYEKKSAGAPMKIRLWFFESWSEKILKEGKPNSLSVVFDVGGDGKADYRARIMLKDGSLVARFRGKGETFFRPAKKPNPQTVKFRAPKSSGANPADKKVALKALSTFVRKKDCPRGCSDKVPNVGGFGPAI